MAATGDLAISAGHDVFLQGSQVAGTNDVTLAALGNVNLTASQDTQMSSGYNQKHESGFGTGGGIGISVGSKTQTDTANTTQVTHTSSTVGSLGGNLNLSAGKDLHVTGSDLVAAQNLTGTGTNVTLDAAADTQHHDETHEVKQSGFTLALKAPVIDAVSNTVDQAHAASRSQDNRAAALHGMAAASGAMDSSGAAGTALGELASGQMPSARIELSYGSSHSKRTYAEDSTTHRGSKVTAGGTAAFVAKGESTPGSGNLTIAGSNVNANDVILAAKNQVSLVNTTDTSSTRSSNESGSASVGISYGTQGFGISASMSKAHGNGSSDSATQNNTHVSAASTATIISGGDTNITGSNLNGRQVSATIGGNLNMASVQDTMSSTAHQESSGGGFTLSQGGGSASVSHTSANASGRYAGVNEQTGIQAGDGGFDISVKGHTGLNGAYLAGSADASKNTLTTGTLTFSDIGNTSNYKASSSGFSAGVSTGDGGANYSTHGNTSGKNTGGGTPMLSQNDSGNDSATTRSSISAGTISVTDAASQRQDITSLNRDASNTNGTIARLPDVNNLLERQADMMAAASAAGEAVSRRIGDYAQSKYDAAKARGDQAGMEAWKEGGTARAGMQVAGAAMVTGLAGGNAPGSAAGAGIASIAAGKLNEISAAIAGSNPTGSADINTALGNIVANAIATGAGAAVGGNAGAVAGGNVDRFNRQLHPEEEKWISEKEAAYAKKYGLTPEQAHNELTMQANLQVQNGSPGTWNQRASAFLGQAHGMLPADGASGPGYMFYATPDQKANPNMYAGYYANGGDLNQPSTQQIQNSASREQQNRNLMGGGVIAAVTGASLLVGGPIAAGAGGLAYSVIGGGVSAGMDAAVQYQQTGEIRPAQSLFAGGVGAIAGPIGANTKFFSNVVLGGSSYFSTTIFNNLYYGEANSPLYAGAIGSLAGAGGYGIGLVLTQGVGRLATPWIFPNLDPKIPAVFQAVRNPLPGLTGATGGGLIGGTGAFAPGKEAQK